jgi:hypothetical protein
MSGKSTGVGRMPEFRTESPQWLRRTIVFYGVSSPRPDGARNSMKNSQWLVRAASTQTGAGGAFSTLKMGPRSCRRGEVVLAVDIGEAVSLF